MCITFNAQPYGQWLNVWSLKFDFDIGETASVFTSKKQRSFCLSDRLISSSN
jgi:hypothetical protein